MDFIKWLYFHIGYVRVCLYTSFDCNLLIYQGIQIDVVVTDVNIGPDQ